MAHLTKLSGVDAVTRLEEMLQWIAPEVEHAIKVEASLEAANDAFKNNFEDVPFDGSTCIRTVQHVTIPSFREGEQEGAQNSALGA